MKVLFIVPYPPELSPSQRFRFEQYLGLLQLQGYQYEIHSFLHASNWRLFSTHGKIVRKIITLVTGYAKRLQLMGRVRQFDRVFIHREAAPLGPPLFEWFIARILRRKVIYDFDDAIWLTDIPQENPVAKFLRWRSKVGAICRMSYRISCGNSYLADYARKYNPDVVVMPTTIDTNLHQQNKSDGMRDQRIVIGWTGSRSTLKYLEPLGDVVAAILKKYPQASFVIIADKPPTFKWPPYTFTPWSRASEVEDLLTLDIGVMPLPDDDWSRGKCGFKALQYMALGIPAVTSPVGVNNEIIQHNISGLLPSTDSEWLECLQRLIEDREFRHTLGEAGRSTVLRSYSVAANSDRFLAIFK